MLDRAVTDAKGKLEDKQAIRDALAAARFSSVRGDFQFNTNQFPINSFYLRVVEKDSSGRITNRTVGKILDAHKDSYVGNCNMKPL
jgi:branched-chain amino acid transport system substrate-binding protein